MRLPSNSDGAISPFMDRRSSCCQCLQRLSMLVQTALFVLCAGWAWSVEDVNESVLSGINERLQFVGSAPIVWPNNAAGQTPGVFPPSGFYEGDSEAMKGSLFSSAKGHTANLVLSFLYFPGDGLPNDLGGGFSSSTMPSASPPDVSAATEWNHLVAALRKAKYVQHPVTYRQRRKGSELDPDFDPSEHTISEIAYAAWQGTANTSFEEVTYEPVFRAGTLAVSVGVVSSDWPEATWGYYAEQTQCKIVIADDARRSGTQVAVYVRGVDPASIDSQNIASPTIVESDGQFHLFQTSAIPSEGEWISAGPPPFAVTEIPWLGGNPGDIWKTVGQSNRVSDSATPVGIAIGSFSYPSAGPPTEEQPETNPDCDDCETPGTSTATSPSQQCKVKGKTSKGSLIDNVRRTFRHWADDYRSPQDPASCRSCSGGGGGGAGSDLPCLSIRRIHRYDLIGAPSSLSPGVFLAQDVSLHVVAPGVIDIIDPQASLPVRLAYDASSSSWRNPGHNLSSSISISSGQPAVGGSAIYAMHDGTAFEFVFVNDGSPNLRARFVGRHDRNGNAISVSYVYPPTANDAELDGNRANIWRIGSISDAHGLSAQVHYAGAMVAGRPVISRIDLPNGSHIDYHYNQASLGFTSQDLVGFSGATLPENEIVAVTATREGGQVRILFDDPGAEGIHRRKTVWLTEPGSLDPRSGNAASYRITEARLGTGEVSYRNRLEQDGANWQSVIQEGSSLMRLIHSDKGRMQRTDEADAWDWSQPTASAAWQTTSTYEWDTKIRPTQWTTSTGKVYMSTPDPVKNAPARIDHQDGTYSESTWNAFAQPLTQRDRTGRQTASEYDGNGNRLSQTVGVGSVSAATTQWTYNGRGQVLTETDPLNAVTDYSYTAAGFLKTVTEPPDALPAPGETAVRAVWTYEYDAAGRRTAMIDPRSELLMSQRRTTFDWDDRNRLICTTYPDSSTETSVYGTGEEANLVVRTKDRNGRVTVYDHDGAGRRIGTTLYASVQDYIENKGEVIEACLYLSGTSQESTCWRRGERIQHAFDGRGRRTSTTVWANATTPLTSTTAYDAGGRPWLQTDPYGRRTIQLHDDEDQLTRTIRELVIGGLPVTLPSLADLAAMNRVTTPNPPYVIEDMIYDDEGRLLERVDGRGTRTTLAYDARGQCTDVTEDAGQAPATTHSDFDLAGRTVASVSPRLVTTKTDYTLRGLLKRVTEAFDSADAAVATERTYSETRKVRYETDANLHTTEYQYGGCCDRLLHVVDPIGYMTSFSYDFVGNRKTVQDPNLVLTDMKFDAQNRILRVTNGANEFTETIYDDNLTDGIGLDATAPVAGQLGGLGFTAGYADGSAVAVVNPLLQTSYEIRDGLGRPVRRIDPLGHVTRLSYDQIVTDTYTPPGGGAAITQQLVATAMTDAEEHTTAQWADGSGRVRVQVDAESHKARLAYDATGNQVGQLDANGVGWSASYNGRGFLLSRTDTRASAPVTTSWGYDLDGNRTSETITIDGVLKTESYTYDLRNRRKSIVDRLNGETTFDYDGVGNLVQITDAQDGITTYIYDERNLLKEETFPGPTGGTRTYTYDPGRRLKTRTQQQAVAGGN